ncbi:MAG: hypothetical protein ACREUE_08810, partial [Panacagrimonas sp.]
MERQYPTLEKPDDGASPTKGSTELRAFRSRMGFRRRPAATDDARRPRRLPRIALWLALGLLGVTVVPVLLLAVVPVWT